MKLALHWRILLGMLLGVIAGVVASQVGGESIVIDWIKPFGTIFINSLKLIAMPLIIGSLIKGVSDLTDLAALSNMSLKTIALYITTTLIAVSIGLTVVNIIKPGMSVRAETREQLLMEYAGEAQSRADLSKSNAELGPLQPLVDLVPGNIFSAASNNGNMLQVIFFSIFFGIGLVLIPSDKAAPVRAFFEGFNEVILKLVDLIMLCAPYGVFALLAALVVEAPSTDLFSALLWYCLSVLLGLIVLITLFYPLLVKIFAGKSLMFFFKGISPAQLVAFSTSSSAATLPVTIERVEEHLGVDEQVSRFVLPIGATINMDGTSLYQGVAAVFIAQAFGMELSLGVQLGILVTATLASIGSAAVPGAGMIMLAGVLAQAGIPEAGLALIFAVDRPLDMCRTVANVTGDAAVSMVIAKTQNMLQDPKVKNWDDNYASK